MGVVHIRLAFKVVGMNEIIKGLWMEKGATVWTLGVARAASGRRSKPQVTGKPRERGVLDGKERPCLQEEGVIIRVQHCCSARYLEE